MTNEEWKAAFGEPTASFDARFQQTLNRLEEEKTMKRFTLRTVILAAAIILALTGAACAAANYWMIGDYFGTRGPGHVPEGFESGYQADYTQEIGNLHFHIRDAYVSGNTLTAMVEVSRKDEMPALFVTEGIEEDDLIANFDQALSFDAEEKRTIAEYARDEGLQIYHVGSWFTQDGKMKEGAGDEWAEDEYRRLVILCQVQDIQNSNGLAQLSWDIYMADKENGYQPKSMTIKLPVEAYTEWTVDVNQAVEGIPVVIDRLMLRQSRMELDVDIAYHLDPDKMPETVEENTAAALHYGSIHLIDPETDEKLPMGSRITGGMRWLDEAHTVFEGTLGSVSGEYVGDTIRLKFYDPWQDAYIASIDIKIR